MYTRQQCTILRTRSLHVGSTAASFLGGAVWIYENSKQELQGTVALPFLLQDTGARKEYLIMEEGGLRRSARKKQLTLKAELNVATEVKFAEWRSWQGKDRKSGKEKPIAVDSEDDTPPKWKRKRAGMSLRSREEIDWSEEEEEGEMEEEEERGEGERMTCKPPMAERKTKQTQGRSRPKKTKVNLECESRGEQSKLRGLSPPETNESGGCTKGEAPSGVGVGEECAEEGGEELPTEGCWSHFRDLCEMLPGRRPQIELLLTLFGEVRSHVVLHC